MALSAKNLEPEIEGTAATGAGPVSVEDPLLARLQAKSTPEKVRLFRYWQSLRENGLPDYRRFDVLDIPELLGDLAVVDVERPAIRFRFRLYGTRVAQIRSRDLTGAYIGDPDVFPDDLNRIYLESYLQVVQSGEPLFNVVPYELQRRSVGHYHRLLLPFTDGARGTGECDVVVLSFQSVPIWAGARIGMQNDPVHPGQ